MWAKLPIEVKIMLLAGAFYLFTVMGATALIMYFDQPVIAEALSAQCN